MLGLLRRKRTRRTRVQKVIDETIHLKRPRRGATLKEEVWQSEGGEVMKYNLAYINPRLCGLDNGRVLG
jgi:hypothetical protein